MARLRKEKGNTADHEIRHLNTGKRSKGNTSDLKEQILALGGSNEDYELLKGVDDSVTVTGTSAPDPSLTKDVSIFLQDLQHNGKESKNGKAKKRQEHAIAVLNDKPNRKHPRQINDVQSPGNQQPRKTANSHKNLPTAHDAPKPSTLSTSRFVVDLTSSWHSTTPLLSASSSTPPITPSVSAELFDRATKLHAADVETYRYSSSPSLTPSTSDASFLLKILQSGTLSDRLSALTLLVQSSPVHNTRALETLKGMAERGKGAGGREESLKAMRCIVDWWVGGGVPDRKLKYMRDQALTSPEVTDRHLVLWFFEDWLKKFFFSVLQILEVLSLDPLPYVRTQALSFIANLLRSKPEQEHNLLRLLVNKLGDQEKNICSRASYELLRVMQAHPAMKSVIVREMAGLVLKPPAPPSTSTPGSAGKHIWFSDVPSKSKSTVEFKREVNAHARYYASITFNQIVLAPTDKAVARQLVDVYFEIFKELLGEGNVDDDQTVIGDNIVETPDPQDRRASKGDRKKGKARAKEVKGDAGFAEVEDAKSKLISAILTGINRALPYAKMGNADAELNKQVDTLFLITHTSTFNISIQALMLIQHICTSLSQSSPSSSSSAGSISDRYYRTLYESLQDPRLATSSKQALYLNLLFKSMKLDANAERVKTFVRRFIQILVTGGNGATEFVAGGLYLLGELMNTVAGLRAMLFQDGKKISEDVYDPRKRDPRYAHASSTAFWELTPLLSHYHPAISLHASQLLSGRPLTASADLSQNTLAHFLDRFVYKNPKKAKPKGESAMQPAAADVNGVKLLRGEVNTGEATVNDEKWWSRRKESDVPVDEVFFHKFFTQRNEKDKAKAAKSQKRRNGDEGEDDESDNDSSSELEGSTTGSADGEGDASDQDSDVEEAEIWKAMKATMPKAAGDQEDFSDLSDDDVPSNLDTISEDEKVQSVEEVEEEENGSDTFTMAEGSDDEDLVDWSEANVPGGLVEYDGSDAGNEEEWAGFGDEPSKKRKRAGDQQEKQGRRKKLKSLPTFASYEDYQAMIDADPEDNI